LLTSIEADLASQEFLAAASVLVERVSRAPTFPAPLLARIFGKRGMAYCSRSDYQRAIADFDRALALDPTYAWAYVLRGMAFSAGEEYQRAIADFDRALALDPELEGVSLLRSQAYWKLNASRRGKEEFERA